MKQNMKNKNFVEKITRRISLVQRRHLIKPISVHLTQE